MRSLRQQEEGGRSPLRGGGLVAAVIAVLSLGGCETSDEVISLLPASAGQGGTSMGVDSAASTDVEAGVVSKDDGPERGGAETGNDTGIGRESAGSGCTGDLDCTGTYRHCEVHSGRCVQCLVDTDCTAPTRCSEYECDN